MRGPAQMWAVSTGPAKPLGTPRPEPGPPLMVCHGVHPTPKEGT